MLVTRD